MLITGGVHAREWAPPDALLRLARQLLDAFKTSTDIVFPALLANVNGPPVTAVSYPSYTFPIDKIKKIFGNVDLYIFPCVNPDGRLYDITHPATPFPPGWRKNRRPNPDRTDPTAVGVDLNRNFDIAWDFARYYDMVLAGDLNPPAKVRPRRGLTRPGLRPSAPRTAPSVTPRRHRR